MNKFRRPLLFMALMAILAGILAACAAPGFGPTTNFVTLPPPPLIDGSEHFATLHYQATGANEESQQLTIFSTEFDLVYMENATIGTSVNEKFELSRLNRRGLMNGIKWGTLEGATINTFDMIGADNGPTMQVVEMEIENANLLTLFRIQEQGYRYVIDKSRLHLYYLQSEPGMPARLVSAKYDERWGWNGAEIAMGQYAVWNDVSWMPAEYQEWGFWARQTGVHPFQMIANSLATARQALDRGIQPSFQGFDKDGARELVLGRQSGFELRRDGQPYGSIELEYSNLFGTMPNTPYISQGALSRIDWQLGGEAYSLVVLTPALSRDQNSLYVFCSDPAVCTQIQQRKEDTWPQLYTELRAGVPGVMLAVHAIGSTQPQTVTFSSDEGSSTEKVGSNAGLQYSVLGRPSFTDVYVSKNLLDYLGWGGVRALGLHYPTSPGSGSGLNYYVRLLLLSLAPDDKALLETGYGMELIEVVGKPEDMATVRAR